MKSKDKRMARERLGPKNGLKRVDLTAGQGKRQYFKRSSKVRGKVSDGEP